MTAFCAGRCQLVHLGQPIGSVQTMAVLIKSLLGVGYSDEPCEIAIFIMKKWLNVSNFIWVK